MLFSLQAVSHTQNPARPCPVVLVSMVHGAHAGNSKRQASKVLPLLVLFSILAGIGGLLLTAKGPYPLSSRWQGALQDIVHHPFTHPYAERAKNSIPASWHQHYQTIQQYSVWLSQPLVSSDPSADSDQHVMQASWQRYIVPSAFNSLQGTPHSSNSIWTSLSVQMPSLTKAGSQLRSWATEGLSKLPCVLPGSTVAESAQQGLEVVEDSLAEHVALKPDLIWQHVRASVQHLRHMLPMFQQQSGSETSSGAALCSCTYISVCII